MIERAFIACLFVVATALLAPISPAYAEPGDAGDAGTSGPSALDALGGGLAFGGWSDAVPLELAPAPRGMVPELGLAIDFRVDDGWMGASMALARGAGRRASSPTKTGF